MGNPDTDEGVGCFFILLGIAAIILSAGYAFHLCFGR